MDCAHVIKHVLYSHLLQNLKTTDRHILSITNRDFRDLFHGHHAVIATFPQMLAHMYYRLMFVRNRWDGVHSFINRSNHTICQLDLLSRHRQIKIKYIRDYLNDKEKQVFAFKIDVHDFDKSVEDLSSLFCNVLSLDKLSEKERRRLFSLIKVNDGSYFKYSFEI